MNYMIIDHMLVFHGCLYALNPIHEEAMSAESVSRGRRIVEGQLFDYSSDGCYSTEIENALNTELWIDTELLVC